MSSEIEIKYRIPDLKELSRKLRAIGFRLKTRRTREMNTLYDLSGGDLRKRKEILRLRQYGPMWTLTHKSKKQVGRHSSREELQTEVADGKNTEAILRALGYAPSFRYEKFRTEWSDGKGQVVVDETPIGNFCEIEGPPRWIDRTAEKLDVPPSHYITKNYATLFTDWKRKTKNRSREMTFFSTGVRDARH